MKNERCINVVACSKSNVYLKCKLICVLCIIGQCEYNTSNSNKSGHIHALIYKFAGYTRCLPLLISLHNKLASQGKIKTKVHCLILHPCI